MRGAVAASAGDRSSGKAQAAGTRTRAPFINTDARTNERRWGWREREEIRSSDGRGPPAPRCEVAGGAGEPGRAGTVVHVSLCLYVRVKGK